MSTPSDPQHPTDPTGATAPQPAGSLPAAPQHTPQHTPQAAPQQVGSRDVRKLSAFLKVSIVLLVALSVASISLLFIGDFEGKFERVFATFAVFAVFVILTAIDTRRDLRSDWYAPVALIGNSYILALALIVTWMTSYSFFLGWDIFWKSLLVIVVVRAVIGCCQVLLGMGEGKPEALSRFAFITSVLAVVSGILFTAPVAIEVFDVHVPDLYWRIAVASLLLTALGLAITLLLRWSYGTADREAKRREHQAQVQAQAQAQETQLSAAQLPPQPVAGSAAQTQQAPQPLLPWPTFPDGRPLPVGPDGQPDFSALGR